MSNIYISLSIFTNLISIILALAGLYLVYKNVRIWRKVSFDLIKARVFLDKKFLENIWLYIVIAGGLITARRIYRFLELTDGIIEYPVIGVLFDVIGLVVIFMLVLIAYQWYKLLPSELESRK